MALNVTFKHELKKRVKFGTTVGTVNRLMIDENGRQLVEITYFGTIYGADPRGVIKPIGQGMTKTFLEESELTDAE